MLCPTCLVTLDFSECMISHCILLTEGGVV
jgi:hypothetical protein